MAIPIRFRTSSAPTSVGNFFFHFSTVFCHFTERTKKQRKKTKNDTEMPAHCVPIYVIVWWKTQAKSETQKPNPENEKTSLLILFLVRFQPFLFVFVWFFFRSIVGGLFILSLFIFHFKLFHFSRFTSAKPRKVLVVFVIGGVVTIFAACVVIVCPVATDVLWKRIPMYISLMLMGLDNAAALPRSMPV